MEVATTEAAWGEAWLVPSHDPMTVREIAARYASVVSAPAPRLTALPYLALWAGGLTNSFVREMRATYYQWAKPFTMDSRQTAGAFGIEPTPLDTALADVAAG